MNWRIIKKSFCLPVAGEQGIVILGSSGRVEVTIDLVRPGARALVLGLVQAHRQDDLNWQVTTVHHQPNTHAETMIYGLASGRAKVRLKGLIKIKKKARRVTDFLTERVLLLSPQAKAWAEPELEIEADEVRASHAAAVAPLDQEELFYLTSRGVALPAAKKLITAGFLNHVVQRIGSDKIRSQVCLMLKK